MHGGTTFARSSDGITTVGFTLDDADAPGNWAYHCHLLHHMEAGMFRKVVVS